jgi:hypothetical protein
MALITDAFWAKYKSLINSVHGDFSQMDIIWMKYAGSLQRYGEDTPSNDAFTPIPLKVLIMFNVARTWPATLPKPGGDIDAESMMVLINLAYLKGLGYISVTGSPLLDPGKDYFVYQGNNYKFAGETPEAQAHDENLFYGFIVSRVPTQTGYTSLNQGA